MGPRPGGRCGCSGESSLEDGDGIYEAALLLVEHRELRAERSHVRVVGLGVGG